MNLKEWAEREGVSYTTARRWFASGKLPVPARKVGGLILVDAGLAVEQIPALALALLVTCARAYGEADALSRALEAVKSAAIGAA